MMWCFACIQKASGNGFAVIQQEAHLQKLKAGRAGGRTDCWKPGFANAGASRRLSLGETGTAGCEPIGRLASSAVAVRQSGRAR